MNSEWWVNWMASGVDSEFNGDEEEKRSIRFYEFHLSNWK